MVIFPFWKYGKRWWRTNLPFTWLDTIGKDTCIALEVLRSVQPLLTSPCHLENLPSLSTWALAKDLVYIQACAFKILPHFVRLDDMVEREKHTLPLHGEAPLSLPYIIGLQMANPSKIHVRMASFTQINDSERLFLDLTYYGSII